MTSRSLLIRRGQVAKQDITVIGASAGGVEPLRKIVAALPSDFSGSVFIVLHLSPTAPTVLPNILGRAAKIPVTLAVDGEKVRPGHIYVAVPDRHMMLEDDHLRLSLGPRENRHRPSIDVLFRSAAKAYGPRVLAVLLSGMRTDGVSGLQAVKHAGGMAVVQAPKEAGFPSLPIAGIELDSPDKVLDTQQIAEEMARRSRTKAKKASPVSVDLERELRFARGEAEADELPPGDPSVYACPDCNGALWRLKEGELDRYRCRVGHAYSESDLAKSKAESLENALWSALRALEESASVENRAAARSGKNGGGRLRESASAKMHFADLIRSALLRSPRLHERTGTHD